MTTRWGIVDNLSRPGGCRPDHRHRRMVALSRITLASRLRLWSGLPHWSWRGRRKGLVTNLMLRDAEEDGILVRQPYGTELTVEENMTRPAYRNFSAAARHFIVE